MSAMKAADWPDTLLEHELCEEVVVADTRAPTPPRRQRNASIREDAPSWATRPSSFHADLAGGTNNCGYASPAWSPQASGNVPQEQLLRGVAITPSSLRCPSQATLLSQFSGGPHEECHRHSNASRATVGESYATCALGV